jgi:nucleoside-diphosphate-sugar epimerase
LLEVDIVGTRTVLDAAAAAGVRRVVLASTNHVAGGIELDAVRGARPSGNGGLAVVRPDSPYGAAKAFGEAYGRFISESTTTAVSCLRIGSVRPDGAAPPEVAPDEVAPYWPRELLAPDALAARLERTRLRGEDLISIVDEELEARDRFRLRWAVSDNPGRPWPLDVAVWNP